MGASIGKRDRGIPMPIMPTENTGMISGPIRKGGGRRRDNRGSRRGGSMMQVTMKDPESGRMYGGLVKDGVPQFKAPDGSTPNPMGQSPRLPDVGPFPDPTLGGPPEREIPMPRERRQRITKESKPRGPAPFAPSDTEMARDRFYERMFNISDDGIQERAIQRSERRDRKESRRDEAIMRASERGDRRRDGGKRGRKRNEDERGRRMKDGNRGERRREDRGERRMRDDDRGGRNRRRRRDFTRKRSRMEGRRSREERGAFRDQYVSTLRR
tara:strand:- start:596 stop:1405 length:810 start_codon:yes stop_codon:yes gene_type:complete